MSARQSNSLFRWSAGVLASGAIVTGAGEPRHLRAEQPQDLPAQAINLRGARSSGVVTPVSVNVDVSTLPKVNPWKRGDPIVEEPQARSAPAPAGAAGAAPGGSRALSVFQSADSLADTPPEFLNPSQNFDGIAFTGFLPPDTNGDVGPNHYVQQANRSVQIFDKAGNSLAGPFSTASLWSAVGGLCSENNPDDVLANYDPLADRFLVSHFVGLGGPTFHQCIAVSQGPNPVTSGWHLYDFVLPASNDYPKISVWPDAYYMSSQRGFPGGGLDVYALDRANMLQGNPATFQTFFVGGTSLILLPSDVDGPAPPAGSPNYFVRQVDGDLWGGVDRLEVFEFHVDWGNPAASTFTGPSAIPVAAFSAECGGGGGLNQTCVTQPGTAQTLDSLSTWTMWRLQYRNFGTYEVMLTDHTVDVDGADHAGVRWYEMRRAGGGAWTLYQQGTYAPDGGAPGLADDPHRFMGSIAMDKSGNIAVGYAVSVDSPDDTRDVMPGIRYAGRLASDPLGLLPRGEVTLVDGAGVQTGSLRYGDYSAMQVDPVDGCTFWYTQEYIAAGGNWATRIGAFRFPSCNQADLRISKIDSPDPVAAGGTLSYSVTVTNDGPSPATDVQVVDTLPTGVTYVTSTDSCAQGPVGTLSCALGSIAVNASKNFTIQVKVNSDVPNGTVLTNTAVVTAHEEDPIGANNTATATTIVNTLADLQVTKVCKPDGPATAGTNAACTILVTNLGPSDAQGVVLTDTLVANGPFTIVSATYTPPGAACGIDNTTHVVTCTLGAEPAGGTTTIVVTVTSPEAVDVNDVATVASITPDPNLANNQAPGQIHFTALANLGITKTDSPDPVVAGTNLTWVITVTNAGPSTAPNTIVRDVLPAEVQVLSATPSTGSCQGGVPGNPAAPMTCALGSVGVGATPTITIVARVLANTPEGSTVHNNVSVASGALDPDNANNVASSFTLVHAEADLAVSKTSDAATYKPSSVVTYTISVVNNGPSDALGVVVTDQLPTAKQAVYQSDTGGCTLSGSVLTCPMGNLSVGQSKYVNVYVLIKGNRGTISNTATVSAQTTDPAAGNNTAVRLVQVK